VARSLTEICRHVVRRTRGQHRSGETHTPVGEHDQGGGAILSAAQNATDGHSRNGTRPAGIAEIGAPAAHREDLEARTHDTTPSAAAIRLRRRLVAPQLSASAGHTSILAS
jgi:hypothetical protein